MWTPVSINDMSTITAGVAMVRAWGDVHATVALGRSLIRRGYRFFYYQDGGSELVWSFFYSPRRQRWYADVAAAAGSVTSQQAAELVVDKILDFMSEESTDEIYQATPVVERKPVVADFFSRLRASPRLAVSISDVMPDAVLWRYRRASP